MMEARKHWVAENAYNAMLQVCQSGSQSILLLVQRSKGASGWSDTIWQWGQRIWCKCCHCSHSCGFPNPYLLLIHPCLQEELERMQAILEVITQVGWGGVGRPGSRIGQPVCMHGRLWAVGHIPPLPQGPDNHRTDLHCLIAHDRYACMPLAVLQAHATLQRMCPADRVRDCWAPP